MPYHRMKLYVGLFVSLLVLGVILLFGIIMEKKGFFDDYESYYFKTNHADNFYVGMSLNVSGFEIGNISSLVLTDSGVVKVFFRVKERNKKWINTETILMLEKPLIGSPSINVKTTPNDNLLKKGAELKIIISDDINAIIVKLQPILIEVEQIIHSMNTITQNFASKEGPLEKTLQNIEVFSAKLANNDAILTSLTGDANTTDTINASLQDTKEIMSNIKQLTQELNTMLDTTQQQLIVPAGKSVQKLDAIFVDIQKKLSTLDATVNTLGSYDKELLILKKELHLNLDKTHQLLEKVDNLLLGESDSQVVLP
ncbi:MAG: hypothetical protein U9R50_02265 [Campylobacterota bacterium]|nr:hypothetical protein [Campylobacterota bacterium]